MRSSNAGDEPGANGYYQSRPECPPPSWQFLGPVIDLLDRRYGLREKADFQRVRRQGRSFSTPILAMYAHPNGGDQSRFGIITGKKIGNAVVRNRAKRRIRESIRPSLNDMRPGFDVLVIARPAIATADFAEIYSTIENLARKSGLYRTLS